MMARRGQAAILGLGLAAAISLGGGAGARADVKPGERERGPDEQGTGRDGAEGGERRPNPLPSIIERMKQVQQRLAETETDRWTQEEQKRIVEALELGGGVVEALEKLIREVESQPPSGGGGGQDRQQQSRSQQSRDRRQRQQQQRQDSGGEQPVDPQARQNQQRQGQREKNDQQSQNDRRSEAEPRPNEYQVDRREAPDARERWGDLPPKHARDVIDARKREKPLQYRKAIEDYLRRLNETRR